MLSCARSARRSSATTPCSTGRSARAGSSTPTTRPRAARSRSSRTSSATRCCRSTRTRTPRRRRPGCRRRALREDARRIIHRAVGGGDDDVVALLRLGRDRRDRQARPCSRPRALGSASPQRPSGRSSSSARTSTTRTSCRGASRSPTWSSIREDARRAASTSTTSSEELERYADRPLKIGSFSAASNVTGIVTDVDARRRSLLHRHGALACWDYAAAGPYLPIDMNPAPDVRTATSPTRTRSSSRRTSSSAARARPACSSPSAALFAQPRPGGARRRHGPVRQPDTSTLPPGSRRSARRAGRPAIVESIRAGLVVRAQGGGRRRRDPAPRAATSSAARSTRGRANPHIEILGNPRARAARDRLASACATAARRCCTRTSSSPLLNDLFGIQARSGCFCAGPVHPPAAIRSTTSGRRGCRPRSCAGTRGAKLAFVRVSFNYFISEAVFEYIVDAVHFLADDGWKLLPLYRFDPRQRPLAPPRRPAAARARRSTRSRAIGTLEVARRGQRGRGARCRATSPRPGASSPRSRPIRRARRRRTWSSRRSSRPCAGSRSRARR